MPEKDTYRWFEIHSRFAWFILSIIIRKRRKKICPDEKMSWNRYFCSCVER